MRKRWHLPCYKLLYYKLISRYVETWLRGSSVGPCSALHLRPSVQTLGPPLLLLSVHRHSRSDSSMPQYLYAPGSGLFPSPPSEAVGRRAGVWLRSSKRSPKPVARCHSALPTNSVVEDCRNEANLASVRNSPIHVYAHGLPERACQAQYQVDEISV